MIPDKVTSTIDHANAVFARLDERDGAVREAARRERERLNSGLARAITRAGVAIGVISLATIAFGIFIAPIGMFGFLAAVGLAIGVAAWLLLSGGQQIAAPNVTPDLPNGQMVQRFDSYLFRARRALPAPAQAELDLLSAQLPSLRQVLERIPDLDPNAQDARRLMSVHLPNLIDRYLHVPNAYRGQLDGEGVTVDQRLVEALAAGRTALGEISEKLARNDLAAFETQGRFIQSRYSEKSIDG
ncbi:MAG TPA: hypothetical protein VNJ05_09750 [Sphingomicrobium sp.]|nr:hypothetical protein [Sphingomicrobium sp.]